MSTSLDVCDVQHMRAACSAVAHAACCGAVANGFVTAQCHDLGPSVPARCSAITSASNTHCATEALSSTEGAHILHIFGVRSAEPAQTVAAWCPQQQSLHAVAPQRPPSHLLYQHQAMAVSETTRCDTVGTIRVTYMSCTNSNTPHTAVAPQHPPFHLSCRECTRTAHSRWGRAHQINKRDSPTWIVY